MPRKNLPAWQQVVLVALRSVPEHDNGTDAWQKLNTGEQAAIMDYLMTHCGDDAQAKLEETCAKIKHPQWWIVFWTILGILVFAAGFMFLMIGLEEALALEVSDYLWLVLCPLNMLSAWQGNSPGRAQQVWKKRAETYEGTTHALNEMHRLYTLPRALRMNKGFFIFWLVMWLIWIGLVLFKNLK